MTWSIACTRKWNKGSFKKARTTFISVFLSYSDFTSPNNTQQYRETLLCGNNWREKDATSILFNILENACIQWIWGWDFSPNSVLTCPLTHLLHDESNREKKNCCINSKMYLFIGNRDNNHRSRNANNWRLYSYTYNPPNMKTFTKCSFLHQEQRHLAPATIWILFNLLVHL